jgi:hypothetical protein
MNGKKMAAVGLIAGAALIALRKLGHASELPGERGQPPHEQRPGYAWTDDAGQTWWVTPLSDGTLHYTYVCTPAEQAAGRCPEGSLRTLPPPNAGLGTTRQWTSDESRSARQAQLDALVAELSDRFGMTADQGVYFVHYSGQGPSFGGPGLPTDAPARRARMERAGMLVPPAGPRPIGNIDVTSVWRGYEAEGRARWAALAHWGKAALMRDWQSLRRTDWFSVYGYPEAAPLAQRKVAFNAFVRFWPAPLAVAPVIRTVTVGRPAPRR